MYNEYYKSWIPDVNVEKLKQNGFYKNILKDISDEDIVYAWDSQVYTLGVQTYNKTGYLEYCSCEGCLVHSQYNYNLLTLATVLKLFLIQRGGDGSLSLTGQINFAETAVLKTGMSKDWDNGYNSSQYGSPYYNLSTLTKELMVIVNKNVTRTRFSNIKSNQMSIQCKRPTGTIFESDTLRVSQTDQKISFNLWLSQNEMLTSEYLNIKYTVQGNPYLDFNAQNLLIFGSNTISIEPNQEDNLEAKVKISEKQGNLLEAKEDGLYSSGSNIDFPITIEQGGTGQTNREDSLLALLPDITGQNGKVLGVVNGVIAWVDKAGEAKNIVFGNGLQESEPDPETQIVTVSTKVNPSEFRYNDNGVIELSDQVTNALAKANSSVQTVNNTPPDEDGNVNVAGSLPVLTLISDFVGEISALRDWLLNQPDQQSILYIKTQKLPNIQVIVTANGFTQTWETLATYIKTQVRALYDGCPNFTCIYNTDGELELSTNDILNPIEMYIPTVPANESLNVQMKLVAPGAVIVSQPYATTDQVNIIVNNAVIPLQQDIRLLNLDMFFADYYIGISINYLLSGKWDGDAEFAYNTILDALLDSNTLKFTLANSTDQFTCPLTITKQQFIDFVDLDTFMDYVSDQITSIYKLGNFRLSYNDNQGFMVTNLDSEVGVLVCEQDNNNLAVIMKLTDLTGAKDRIYTEFSQESLQQQIIDNKLIINDVFINKIKNGENVTIDVDPETNTATFSATGGGSGGANKVTVTINEQNPVAYNVDGTGNITINIPLTTSLKSNLLNITTIQSGVNKGETELIAETTNQLSISTITKQIGLSSQTATDVAKGSSALQRINVTPNNGLAISDKIANEQTLTGIPATATNIGMVKPDNTTIVINGNGTITADSSLPFIVQLDGGIITQNIYAWLLQQPNQQANLYFATHDVPLMTIVVLAEWASAGWDSFLTFIRTRIAYLYPPNQYPSLKDFSINLIDNRLYVSTHLASNPISIYNPENPTDVNNLNAQLRLTTFTGATIGILNINQGVNGLDQGQINLGYGINNAWVSTQLFHPVPLYGRNWEFDLNTRNYIIKGGNVLNLNISGTFELSESFMVPNTKLYIALVNVNNIGEYYAVEIKYKNEPIIIQSIKNATIVVDLTNETEIKEYKLIIYSAPHDYTVYFKISDYLGVVLTYE